MMDVGTVVMTTRPAGRAAESGVGGARYGGSLPQGGKKAASVAQVRSARPEPRQEQGQDRDAKGGRQMVVLRREIGDVLRFARQRQGRTLREVSSAARVSLGYLSEVERGQKEASSELLGSICDALDVPMSELLREVSDNLALAEAVSSVETLTPATAAPRGPLEVTNLAA